MPMITLSRQNLSFRHLSSPSLAMVNRGCSGGCVTCKDRRVKCDEAKPDCRACQRLRLRCGGYRAKPARLKFKDQGHKFNKDQGHKFNSGPHRAVVLSRANGVEHPGPGPLINLDIAVPFFLRNYADLGRDMESTRGFFELLIPV